MRGFNRAFIVGHLGHRPEMKATSEGKPYTQLRIATNRYMGSSDPAQKKTDWFNVMVWGKQAETAAKYLDTGHGVMVEAYMDTYQVENEEGSMERRVGLHALHLEFLQRPKSQ
jgi:single-strand DNA-binding protein